MLSNLWHLQAKRRWVPPPRHDFTAERPHIRDSSTGAA
eukprot:gene7501-5554_t